MKKKQIAILGGAFDPPTIGHIKLAQFVLNESEIFDEVWLCPCVHHMYDKQMESFSDRFRMCEIMRRGDPRIRVFSYDEGDDGGTYHFVKSLLNSKWADDFSFSLIIGQDNANTFERWVNYKELEKMIRFVVVSRKGEERNIESDWYLNPPHIYLCGKTEIPNISSTKVRDLIQKSTVIHDVSDSEASEKLVNEVIANTSKDVVEYIQERKLYYLKKK